VTLPVSAVRDHSRRIDIFRPVLTFAMDPALESTICLLATFLGIGMVVNGLIAYIVVVALGERTENRRGRERRPGADATRTAV
jgi:hypothetical protein